MLSFASSSFSKGVRPSTANGGRYWRAFLRARRQPHVAATTCAATTISRDGAPPQAAYPTLHSGNTRSIRGFCERAAATDINHRLAGSPRTGPFFANDRTKATLAAMAIASAAAAAAAAVTSVSGGSETTLTDDEAIGNREGDAALGDEITGGNSYAGGSLDGEGWNRQEEGVGYLLDGTGSGSLYGYGTPASAEGQAASLVSSDDAVKSSTIDGMFGKYEIGRLLGEGAFGMVFEARAVSSDRRVALKQISKEGVRREEVMSEMTTLNAIHAAGGHDNIAGVLDVFEDSDSYFFVLELVSGGEMFEHLTRNGPYSEATAAGFMRELAAALCFLHSNEIIHADLKPENLMLSSWNLGESKLKVVDFGSSLRTGTKVDLTSGSLGTACYLPPEALFEPPPDSVPACDSESFGRGIGGSDRPQDGISDAAVERRLSTSQEGLKRPDRQTSSSSSSSALSPSDLVATPALDIWAAGCILYIMLIGAHPFDLYGNSTEIEVLERVRTGSTLPLEDVGTRISDSAKDLVSRLMARDAKDRLTAEEMMRHPWIQGTTAPESLLEGSDARLSRFRDVLSQKLETGVVSMLVGGAVAEGNDGFPGGYGRRVDADKEGVVEAVDVVKKAYKAMDRRGTGRVSAKDIAGFLKEHSAEISEDERRAVNEAVSVAKNLRRPSGNRKPWSVHKKTGLSRRASPHSSREGQAAAGAEAGNNAFATTENPYAKKARDKVAGENKANFVLSEKILSPPSTKVAKESDVSDTVEAAKAAVTAVTAAVMAKAPPPAAGGTSGTRGSSEAAGAATESDSVSPLWADSEDGDGAAEDFIQEEAELDMTDFEELLGHLKTKEYPAGEYLFREGDAPDGGLYFIVEGKVDVLVNSDIDDADDAGAGGVSAGKNGRGTAAARPRRPHTRVASMGPGDFFGEGGVVSAQPRGESVRAATPLKVINVSLSSCNRMIDAPGKVSANLRRVALSRALFRAKNVVRAIHSVRRRHLGEGEAVFRQGDNGASLFTVDEGQLDVVKEHGGVSRTVARLVPGSCFGEMALMTAQPRSASVVCASNGKGCLVDEISGDDFARLLTAGRTGFRRDVMRMLRARQFRHGVYKLLTELGADATFTDQELRRVFDRADTTKSGTLTLAELKTALCRTDPNLEESAVAEIMTMLDVEAIGNVSFEEFLKVIRWDP